MDIKTMRKIVDGAPKWAVAVNVNNDMYYDKSEVSKGDIWLIDLRIQLTKREPMDLRSVDIPHGTIILEK